MDPAGQIDWNAVLARYRPLALRVAAGLVGAGETAEDLVQEAARAVLEHPSSFESPQHARNYLLRTLRNLAVESLRRGGRVQASEWVEEAADPAPKPLDAVLAREEEDLAAARLQAVRTVIDHLRPVERDAVYMRYFEGLGYREMAERSGDAISTLQGRVEAALGKIRGRIGKEAGNP